MCTFLAATALCLLPAAYAAGYRIGFKATLNQDERAS